MSISASPTLSAIHGRGDPQAIVASMEVSSQRTFVEKQPFLRRSWYSLTFDSDTEYEEQPITAGSSSGSSGSGTPPAAPAHTSATFTGSESRQVERDPADCRDSSEEAVDYMSDASTDVGSDDEDDECEECRQECQECRQECEKCSCAAPDSDCEQAAPLGAPNSASSEAVHHDEQEIEAEEIEAPQVDFTNAETENSSSKGDDNEYDDPVAMAQRRLLKRQRQRQERREQRSQARAERSARWTVRARRQQGAAANPKATKA